MQDKIIAAIAAYLEKETSLMSGMGRSDKWIEFGGSLNPAGVDHAGFCQEIAREIYTSIAPLVEAGEQDWKDAPEWAKFRTTNSEGDVTYWEHMPECTPLGFWVHGEKYGRMDVKEIKKGHLERRPQ